MGGYGHQISELHPQTSLLHGLKDVIRVGAMPHSFLHSVVGADSQVTINGIAAFCSGLSHDFAAWPLWRAYILASGLEPFAAVKAHLLAAS